MLSLTGSMNAKQRAETLKEFEDHPEAVVLLMSQAVQAGVNMAMSNILIIAVSRDFTY